MSSLKSLYFSLAACVLCSIIVLGLICPFLVSFKSTFLSVLGIMGMIVYLYFLIMWIIWLVKLIKKMVENAKKGETK